MISEKKRKIRRESLNSFFPRMNSEALRSVFSFIHSSLIASFLFLDQIQIIPLANGLRLISLDARSLRDTIHPV